MSKPNVSPKNDPHQRALRSAYTDEQAESLTDLIDVLQRQSFTRRFEPQTDVRVIERDLPPRRPTTRAPSRGEPSG